MSASLQLDAADGRRVEQVLRRYWGYDSLRPLQAEAIAAALAGRDSLVVMPTGGGKSLCYQVPPLLAAGTDVVVSPLIALMKDQVDALRECGVPAAAIHSGLEAIERRSIEADLAAGKFRLVFVAPERVLKSEFLDIARQAGIRRFAIDEAHCISQWGHDFRPEYRQLAALRDHFPHASLHAFTATATPRVRTDIVDQLRLKEPALLVGIFDRPNLVYRVVPQVDQHQQALEIVQRHAGEAVIIYCLSRKETEAMAASLKDAGIRAANYHAGLPAEQRHRTQDDFSEERTDVVVATVAFGMGIDRSNIRAVVHASLPKSIEHYQQETGRAGRDGLEAECVLLYTAGDVMRWESLLTKSAAENEQAAAALPAQLELLRHVQRFAGGIGCRHKALSEYFGQPYAAANCGACDICLEEDETIEDGTVTAQKILSCIARTQERFGVGHVVDVLLGADTEQIRRCGHDRLSTYGLLEGHSKKELQSLVYQLVDQHLLERTADDRPTLRLNDDSWAVMRGQKEVRFRRPRKKAPRKTRLAEQSWEGADRGLFEHLREWRREIARERKVPPYIVAEDRVLVDLARVRPTTPERLGQVRGIGQRRLADLGPTLLSAIALYCREHALSTDVGSVAATDSPAATTAAAPKQRRTETSQTAFAMFGKGKSIDEVVAVTGRARTTVHGYLAEWIAREQPARIDQWVDDATYQRVTAAAATLTERRLKPVFESLSGEISYEVIRLVLAHLESTNVPEF